MNKWNNRLSSKFLHRSILQLCSWLAMVLAPYHGSTIAAPPTPFQIAQARADLRTYYTWINAPWIGDDQAYQHVRDIVEQAISSGKRPNDLLKLQQRALAKAPNNYQAQFAYYYVAYKVVTGTDTDTNIGLQVLSNMSTVVIRSPHPHTYNFVRLVFLCDQYNWINPKLKSVGLRLMHHDPNDYDSEFYTVSTLLTSSVPTDQALALTYAKGLVQRYPKKASAHSLIGSVYYQSWRRTQEASKAMAAIAEYQQYLNLAPSKDGFRKQVERYIAQMQKG